MLKHVHHHCGAESGDEILFETRFGYMFPKLARTPAHLVDESDPATTRAALTALGEAMGDPGTPATPVAGLDSSIPAVFTYFGQFIDHDITARTDRNTETSEIGDGVETVRRSPDEIVTSLFNGRRPQLDLDSLYGDGPALVPNAESDADAFGLYRANLTLNVQRQGQRVDLPRRTDGRALIADGRNDENVIISQLHAALLAFHNAVANRQPGTPAQRYVRARQLVRWAYQYVVLNEYLPAVCHPAVVEDVLANGPRFIGDSAGQGGTFMPLEFSVAAFRFGHSMIRPFYVLNGFGGEQKRTIDSLFFPGMDPATFLDGNFLKADFTVDWDRFVPQGDNVQFARRIDPRLSKGLSNLTFESDALLKKLAARNLLRGYNLSIPTGQAVARCFGVAPLTSEQLVPPGPDGAAFANALNMNDQMNRTPLWYYLLQEAAVQTGGQRLGELGSRLVAETLVSLVKNDPNSYLNHRHDPAVKERFIDVMPGIGGRVNALADMLKIAGVL